MKTAQKTAAIAGAVILALPFAASAQVYYYAPNTMSGPYISDSYNSYIPAAAMPYVELGQQMQEQYQGYSYPSYSYPSQTQYQEQSQSETSYPSYEYSYPTYEYSSYPSYQSVTPTQLGEEGGEYAYEPQVTSYPSGTTGPFGQQMCYYSDSTTYEPCGHDPQQWVQDPYTGDWY